MDEFAQVRQWMAKFHECLDLDGLEDPDLQDLLDTVRAVAHQALHAAGPVAAFAAGYATARAGGSAQASGAAFATIRDAVAADE